MSSLGAIDASGVLAVIMGGGRGTRLFPLTAERSKPAVPLAGKYRLVDIPISNCINSSIRRIFLLTQFNSASLHRHVRQSYRFDRFSRGFVEIMAAEQTPTSSSWYEGTADAVRKNLSHLRALDFDYVLILSGDQLYRMDYRDLLLHHVASGAEVSVSTTLVGRAEAPSFGVMQVDPGMRIVRFEEKPREPELLDSLRLDPESLRRLELPEDQEWYLASMGIYLFNRSALEELLDNDYTDFGKHIIPMAIERKRVFAYAFKGYWEDIGTIRSFFKANLDLTADLPRFNFFDMAAPIYSRPRALPASKVNSAAIDHAVIADGCILNRCAVAYSVIGLRTVAREGARIHRCVVMGADYYESRESIEKNAQAGRPPIGVGRNCRIENAIVDKNARIGDNCILSPEGKPENFDHELYYIRDGILILPKNAVIPHNTAI